MCISSIFILTTYPKIHDAAVPALVGFFPLPNPQPRQIFLDQTGAHIQMIQKKENIFFSFWILGNTARHNECLTFHFCQ